MLILWDEPKRISNRDKHGLDFADLDEQFFYEAVILPARMGRLKAVGYLFGNVVTVIFSQLGREAWSVVSLRYANFAERSLIE